MAALMFGALLLVPAATAFAMLVAWRRPGVQSALAIAMSVASLALSLWLLAAPGTPALAVGGWAPPVGIGLRADGLSRLMLVLTGVVFTAATLAHRRARAPSPVASLPWPMLLFALDGLFVTADFFNFYVFFELVAVSSYLLVSQGRHRPLEAAWKYSAQSVVGSLFLLVGVLLLYRATGTLAMAEAAGRLAGPAGWLAPFFLVAFLLKGALFPFHFWQPDAHAAASTAGSMVLAGLLIKVGLYGLMRFSPLLIDAAARQALLAVGVASIVVGAVAAWQQADAKRLLGFSSISQLGFVLVGLGWGTPGAVAAAIFYMVGHSLSKALLFAGTGALADAAGGTAFDRLAGAGRGRRGLAGAYLLGVASLVGLPPTVGFVGKLALVAEGVRLGAWPLVAVLAIGSLLTLAYGTRTYQRLFWEPGPAVTLPAGARPEVWGLALVVLGAAALGAPLWALCLRSAHELAGGLP